MPWITGPYELAGLIVVVLAIFLLVLIFRQPIQELLPRLREATGPGGFSVKLQEQVQAQLRALGETTAAVAESAITIADSSAPSHDAVTVQVLAALDSPESVPQPEREHVASEPVREWDSQEDIVHSILAVAATSPDIAMVAIAFEMTRSLGKLVELTGGQSDIATLSLENAVASLRARTVPESLKVLIDKALEACDNFLAMRRMTVSIQNDILSSRGPLHAADALKALLPVAAREVEQGIRLMRSLDLAARQYADYLELTEHTEGESS